LNFTSGISLLNTKSIRWGTRIEILLKEFKPKKEVQGDCLTLTWGDTNFFGTILTAKSIFYPEETLVKDRHIHEIILSGKIESEKHPNVVKEIIREIGDPTGHLELPNLSSHNWMHDDIEVSSNFISSTKVLKILIKR
jgi:hypothetical protein